MKLLGLKEQNERTKTLIGEFWEMEASIGASDKAVHAAWDLQQFLGYETAWDAARERRVALRALPQSVEVQS